MNLIIPPSHESLSKIRDAIKRMRAACHKIGLRGQQSPVDILVPEDGMLESMPPEMLEQALVLITWPGVDIRHGGQSDGKVRVGEGQNGVKVMYFDDRHHVVRYALETIDKAAAAMEMGNDPGSPAHSGTPGGGEITRH